MTRQLLIIGLLMEVALAFLVVRPLSLWRYPHPAIDLHIVTIVGENWGGLIWFLFSWGLLISLYLSALLASRGEPDRWTFATVLGLTTVYSVTLLAIYPATSADIFHYLMDARIRWLYGENPLIIPPSAHSEDPFASYASWPDTPAPYGPLWLFLSWLPHTLGGGQLIPTLLAFKALASLFSIAATLLIYLSVVRTRPRYAVPAAILYGWSPLVLFNTAGDGHNDAVMLAFMLGGLYLLINKRPSLGLALLLTAGVVKAPALLLVPLVVIWLWRTERRERTKAVVFGLILGGSVLVVAYTPFWSGPRSLAATVAEGGFFTASLATVLYRGLQLWMAATPAEIITNLAGRGLYVGMYAFLLRYLWYSRGVKEELLRAGFWAVYLYLAIAAFWFMPWYALWPLGLAAVTAERESVAPALVLSVTAMLTHAVFGFGAAILGLPSTSTRVELFAALTIWTAPFLVTGVIGWKKAISTFRGAG